MFTRLTTQFVIMNGAHVGLRYSSIEFLFKTYRPKNRAELFDKIQIMEFAALKLLNKAAT